jgi:hypothetical protein
MLKIYLKLSKPGALVNQPGFEEAAIFPAAAAQDAAVSPAAASFPIDFISPLGLIPGGSPCIPG